MINETDIEAMAPEKLGRIAILETEEEANGSLKVTYVLDEYTKIKMAGIGVEFTLYCAAAGLDLQDALSHILTLVKEEESYAVEL